MTQIRRLIGTALLAGLVAGLALSAARQAWVVPLILQAEQFETSAPHAHDAGPPPSPEWQPAAGLERSAWTWAANVLTGCGFALLLVAGYLWSGRALTAWRGLLWGLAGYAAASLAPALGLPPALPGAPEADLAARQVWWLSTVAATAAGLAAFCFAPSLWLRLLGLPLLALPHVIGAPRAAEPPPPALAELLPRFVAATLLCNLGFWLLLGAVSGWAGWRTGQRAAE